jgi:hypothetical protein
MINLALPDVPKEVMIYVVIAITGGVLMLGSWSIGVSQGAEEGKLQLQPKLDALSGRVEELLGQLDDKEAELIACKAQKAGECVLQCESVCRERVKRALDVRGALCSPSH